MALCSSHPQDCSRSRDPAFDELNPSDVNGYGPSRMSFDCNKRKKLFEKEINSYFFRERCLQTLVQLVSFVPFPQATPSSGRGKCLPSLLLVIPREAYRLVAHKRTRSRSKDEKAHAAERAPDGNSGRNTFVICIVRVPFVGSYLDPMEQQYPRKKSSEANRPIYSRNIFKL